MTLSLALTAMAPLAPLFEALAFLLLAILLLSRPRSGRWARVAATIAALLASLAGLAVLAAQAAGPLADLVAGMAQRPVDPASLAELAHDAGRLLFLAALPFALGCLLGRRDRLRPEPGLPVPFEGGEAGDSLWQRFVERLEGAEAEAPERLAERVVGALAEAMGVPGGALWRDEGGDYFRCLAARHLPFQPCEAGRAPGLASALLARGGPIDLAADVPSSRPLPTRAWVMLPLIHDGRLFGFAMLAEPDPSRPLGPEDRRLLSDLARVAAAYLSGAEDRRRLAEERHLDSFARRAAFAVHGFKNVAGRLALILANARRHEGNPEFYADMLETLEDSVARMNRLIAELRTGSALMRVDTIPLAGLLAEIVERRGESRVRLAPIRVDPMVRCDRERLAQAIDNLIDNALESASYPVHVDIALATDDGLAEIAIADNGAGMSEEFVRTQLMKPLRSSKPGGLGLGVLEAKEMAEAFGGSLVIDSAPGRGTVMRLRLPRIRELAE